MRHANVKKSTKKKVKCHKDIENITLDKEIY